ncbi:MAG: HIT family protein [Luteolibacter sp.]
MNSCIFCRIIRGELSASWIFEDSLVTAFLDISPVNGGHVLVVPRRHVASLTDLTSAEIECIARTAQQVAAALKSTLPECEGVSLSMADGEAAGQEVPHAHLHVIPRHRGDGFGWRRLGSSMDRTQLDDTASRIRHTMEISGAPDA